MFRYTLLRHFVLAFTSLFYIYSSYPLSPFFFFNDTATTEIYTLSLHDALPISCAGSAARACGCCARWARCGGEDRKSTRLNSSHEWISYAVFCLKKKKKKIKCTRVVEGNCMIS